MLYSIEIYNAQRYFLYPKLNKLLQIVIQCKLVGSNLIQLFVGLINIAKRINEKEKYKLQLAECKS